MDEVNSPLSKHINLILLLLAALLTAFGDLRNLIGPLAYWTAWTGYASYFIIKRIFNRKKLKNHKVVGVFFACFMAMIFSSLLAALINSSIETTYQSVKLMAIGLVAYAVFCNSAELGWKDFLLVAKITVTVQAIVFVSSMMSDWHLMLGDGRQGSLIAYPGVMWKTGAYLLPIFLARLHLEKKDLWNYLSIGAALYLIISDGSRTGFILVSVMAVGYLILQVRNSLKTALALSLLACVLGLFYSVGALPNFDRWYENYGTEVQTAVSRISEDDAVRRRMLSDGLDIALECFPWGCGFGATSADFDTNAMVVHNGYLSVQGHFGIIALIGFGYLLSFHAFSIKSKNSRKKIINAHK